MSTSDPSPNNQEQPPLSPREATDLVFNNPNSSYNDRYEAATTYLDALAKPVGSLGTLEQWAARLAAIQGTLKPKVQNPTCFIFAGDHGVAASVEDGGEGCSLYPQAVTRAVLVGLERDVAGASVLARANQVQLKVIDVGVVGEALDGSIVTFDKDKLVNGTRNFCVGSAMTEEECSKCIEIGRAHLVRAVEDEESMATNVVCLGEVGIGNTTSSSALIAALTSSPIDDICGGGAYASKDADMDAIRKKQDIVTRALKTHDMYNVDGAPVTGLDALVKLGGAEIAALVGAMLEASKRKVAVLVDGFICTAAALVAVNMNPNVCRVLFLSSQSAEKGQRTAIERIQAIAKKYDIPIPASPALSMGLRMGEGTAALLAVPLLRSSAAVLSDMATIQDILK